MIYAYKSLLMAEFQPPFNRILTGLYSWATCHNDEKLFQNILDPQLQNGDFENFLVENQYFF